MQLPSQEEYETFGRRYWLCQKVMMRKKSKWLPVERELGEHAHRELLPLCRLEQRWDQNPKIGKALQHKFGQSRMRKVQICLRYIPRTSPGHRQPHQVYRANPELIPQTFGLTWLHLVHLAAMTACGEQEVGSQKLALRIPTQQRLQASSRSIYIKSARVQGS
jgi:hypothetical protein